MPTIASNYIQDDCSGLQVHPRHGSDLPSYHCKPTTMNTSHCHLWSTNLHEQGQHTMRGALLSVVHQYGTVRLQR